MAAPFHLDILAASVPFYRGDCVSLVLPLAYFAFGMARGATGKPIGHTKRCYPYPFMDPQVMGKRFWPVVLLLIAAFFGLGCLFVGISRLL